MNQRIFDPAPPAQISNPLSAPPVESRFLAFISLPAEVLGSILPVGREMKTGVPSWKARGEE